MSLEQNELRFLYDTIIKLAKRLELDQNDWILGRPDYRKVKALGACYELQEYFANMLADTEEASQSVE